MTATENSVHMFTQALWAENAGIFWLGAELFILWAMLRVRIMISPYAPEATHIRKQARLLVYVSLAVCGCLAIVLNARHAFIPPPHWVWEHSLQLEADEAADQIAAAYEEHSAVRRGVWYGFVTAWVVLEPLIVYQGWRAFRSLVRITEDHKE